MSPLAKVFVVVNLILSMAFFGTSAALFATRTNWRNMADEYKVKAQKDIAALAEQYKTQGDRLAEVDKDRTRLNTNYNTTLGEKEKLRGQLNETQSKLAQSEHRIEAEVKEKTGLNSRLQDLEKANADLKALVDAKTKEADDAKAKEATAIAEYTRIRVDLDKANEEKSNTNIELVKVKSDLESARISIKAAEDAGFDLSTAIAAPPIDAVVQAVKAEDKLVVLSVGRDQKVQEGYEFTVYRGDKFVGKVKVIKVWDELAGAQILYTQENESVRVGDKAATQI